MLRWSRALVLAGGLALAWQGGCARRVPLRRAAAYFPSGLHAHVDSAYIDGRTVLVKLRIMNGSAVPIYINPDGMGLRLPDSRVLRRTAIADRDRDDRVPARDAEVYHGLRRGFARTWILEFAAPPDAGDIVPATLIVGGVSFGADPTPIVVGELPLRTTRTPPGARPEVLSPPR